MHKIESQKSQIENKDRPNPDKSQIENCSLPKIVPAKIDPHNNAFVVQRREWDKEGGWGRVVAKVTSRRQAVVQKNEGTPKLWGKKREEKYNSSNTHLLTASGNAIKGKEPPKSPQNSLSLYLFASEADEGNGGGATWPNNIPPFCLRWKDRITQLAMFALFAIEGQNCPKLKDGNRKTHSFYLGVGETYELDLLHLLLPFILSLKK